MQLTVSGFLNQFQQIMQGVSFPTLEEHSGQLVAVLGLIQIEALVASSFVAKAVYPGHSDYASFPKTALTRGHQDAMLTMLWPTNPSMAAPQKSERHAGLH